MINARMLSTQLRELRKECEMPLWDFAGYLGINSQYLSVLENTEDKFFTINVFNNLAEIVEYTLHKSIRLVFHFGNGKTMSIDEATKWIVAKRKEEGQSQLEYSVKKGLAPGAITRLERGQIKGLKSLAEIANAHNATLEIEAHDLS